MIKAGTSFNAVTFIPTALSVRLTGNNILGAAAGNFNAPSRFNPAKDANPYVFVRPNPDTGNANGTGTAATDWPLCANGVA